MAWSKYHYKNTIETYEEILSTVIWGNSLVRRQNKHILDKVIINSNIDCVADLVSPGGGRWVTYEELLAEKGPVITEFWYWTLISAIPVVWKSHIRATEWNFIIDCDTAIEKLNNKTMKPTRIIYWALIEGTFSINNATKLCWQVDLQTMISDEQWWCLYPNFMHWVKPAKLQSFQYRVLTRSLTTNVK